MPLFVCLRCGTQAWPFDRVYGGWFERGLIASGGKAAVAYSVARYLRAISRPPS